MLKFLFSFVLIIFCWRVEAQQIKKDTTGIADSVVDSFKLAQQKKDSSKVFQFYLDGSVGFILLAGLADINAGYHLTIKSLLVFLTLAFLLLTILGKAEI